MSFRTQAAPAHESHLCAVCSRRSATIGEQAARGPLPAVRASRMRPFNDRFTAKRPSGAIHLANLSSGSIIWPRHISR